MATITDPLIELLAIKLYEHDTQGNKTITMTGPRDCWAIMDEEDRESYRQMARGETPLYGD